MSEEKIVYILDANISLLELFAFLSFKEQYIVPSTALFEALCLSKNRRNHAISIHQKIIVLDSLTLVHNPNIFLLLFMILMSDKKLSNNNPEVNL